MICGYYLQHLNIINNNSLQLMSTQRGFQSLDEKHQELSKQAFEFQNPVLFEKQGKYRSCGFLWRNLQKIVTLLLLVYLVVLILNLIISKDNYLALNIPILPYDDAGHNNVKSSQRQKSLIPKQNLLKEMLKEASTFVQKSDDIQSLTEIRNSQTMQKSMQIPKRRNDIQISTTGQEEKVAEILSSMPQTSQKNPESSDLQNDVEYSNFISEFNKEKEALKQAEFKNKIQSIYKELGDDTHQPIHALSLQEVKVIINQYTKNPDSMLLNLIVENSVFNLTRSKEDITYQSHINKEHLNKEHPTQQLCVIVSSQNNAHNSQILRTLNSIYNQHYKPYNVIIAQRNSIDRTATLISNYLKKSTAFGSKTKVVQIDTDSEPLAVLTAAKSCKQGSLALYLDGNTQLLGKEVFKMINHYFAEYKANIVYANHYNLDVANKKLSLFNTAEYDESEQFMLAYRKIPAKYGKIMAFKTNAMLRVSQNFIKFNEKYFEYSGIDSLAVSLLEMSCGNIKSINEPLGMALIDSTIEKQEEAKRKTELRHVAEKLKIDIC